MKGTFVAVALCVVFLMASGLFYAKNQTLKAEVTQLQATVDTLSMAQKDLTAKFEQTKKKLGDQAGLVAPVQKKLDDAIAMVTTLTNEKASLMDEIEKLKAQIAGAVQAIAPVITTPAAAK